MKVVSSFQHLQQEREKLTDPLGFVPTMGFLHEGHLSLVRQAGLQCRSVAVSIFVNPTQFGENEDLSAYPRDLERDMEMLKKEGVDLVWTPTAAEMYPANYQTWVEVEGITELLEGVYRPGHFKGVTTVVAKLFNAVQPERAYFGQKDAQQAMVVKKMARELSYPMEIVVCPIVREADGLAMSSRNTYLNPDERQAATVLYRAISAVETAFESGTTDAGSLREVALDLLEAEPLAKVQYVSLAHPDTFAELEGMVERGLLSMAVHLGKTRLIDNVLLGK